MKWRRPPTIKIYEALGALADGRVEILSETSARVFSSSGGKFYTVTYDPERRAIMANDNGSYWQGYVGYPAIAFLMKIGRLSYSEKLSRALKGIAWKDLNTRFKNDFDKTLIFVQACLEKQKISAEEAAREADHILNQIEILDLSYLGKRQKPSEGY